MDITNRTNKAFRSQQYCQALPGWNEPKAARERIVIGILPGEGIGPEVVSVALRVLDAVSNRLPSLLEIRFGGDIGTVAEKKSGNSLTDEVVSFCETVFQDGGALLCGAGGGRFVYSLRKRFDLFCKFSPIRPLPILADTGVIRPEAKDRVDIVAVRENAGGLYLGEWGSRYKTDGSQVAYHQFEYSKAEVDRILSVAISLAKIRSGRLCVVLKPDGIPSISDLWRSCLDELCPGDGMDIRILEIDNATYQLIADAPGFDVVVSPNMFGDVLADCAALLLGSRGMSFSGNFNTTGNGVYQTGHGAARDLAGSDTANPVGQVHSLAMMLRQSFGLDAVACTIENAVAETLRAGWRTFDIAGPDSRIVGTRELGDRFIEAIENNLASVA